MTENPYILRKSRLLKDFDKAVARIRPLLLERYGAEQAAILERETRQEYELLIPQLPYLGDRQPFTQFIISTAWFLAIHRVLERHGGTIEETGQLIYDASAAFLKASPGFVRRMLGFMSFSPRYLKAVRKRAAESQLREYPGDYVYSYIEGDSKTFDYGVDYTECATCKFLSAQGVPELAPYICAIDRLYSEMLGWGLVRTLTLAEGDDRCDFRFKRGGPTRVAILPGLRQSGGQM